MDVSFVYCIVIYVCVWTVPGRAGGRWGGILTATRVLLVSLCASSPHPRAEHTVNHVWHTPLALHVLLPASSTMKQ